MAASAVDARLWGKARGLTTSCPVICHLLNTAADAGALWDMTLTEEARALTAQRLGVSVEACRQWLCLWAGLHDIGKISPPFQAMVPETYKALTDAPRAPLRTGTSPAPSGRSCAMTCPGTGR
ncbi:HD domain-containing protein [Streptomyces olivochromogenes]|uniref:HD domain-containing protein n=1 Tax=Streptomyces olivochromogenes TaxID=1963 RepID=UPI003693A00D